LLKIEEVLSGHAELCVGVVDPSIAVSNINELDPKQHKLHADSIRPK
jgi:hypothetical protein